MDTLIKRFCGSPGVNGKPWAAVIWDGESVKVAAHGEPFSLSPEDQKELAEILAGPEEYLRKQKAELKLDCWTDDGSSLSVKAWAAGTIRVSLRPGGYVLLDTDSQELLREFLNESLGG